VSFPLLTHFAGEGMAPRGKQWKRQVVVKAATASETNDTTHSVTPYTCKLMCNK